MSDFFTAEAQQDQPGNSTGILGPTPESVSEFAEQVKVKSGADSYEYASAQVKIGDAHMRQGRLANPRAQLCYEHALQIVQARGKCPAETAYLLDKLSSVKQSSGDTTSAATDLKIAIEIWKTLTAQERFVSDEHIARRTEDLERMEKVIAFQNSRPPDL